MPNNPETLRQIPIKATDNCNLVYGDAQAVLAQMIQATKDLVPAEAAVPA